MLVQRECSADIMSHTKYLSHISHLSFITDDEYTGPHEIRITSPPESMVPVLRVIQYSWSSTHLSTCHTDHFLDKYGVAEVIAKYSVTL